MTLFPAWSSIDVSSNANINCARLHIWNQCGYYIHSVIECTRTGVLRKSVREHNKSPSSPSYITISLPSTTHFICSPTASRWCELMHYYSGVGANSYWNSVWLAARSHSSLCGISNSYRNFYCRVKYEHETMIEVGKEEREKNEKNRNKRRRISECDDLAYEEEVNRETV